MPVAPTGISLLLETNSLIEITGNRSLWLRKGSGISALATAGESDIGKVPCTFPTDQGTDSRDKFARDDCTHRHTIYGFPYAIPCASPHRDPAV